MTEIKPVAWTNDAQLGFVKDPKWTGIPMAMWGERENYAMPDVALCRQDEAMAEIERLERENFAKDEEIARLRKALEPFAACEPMHVYESEDEDGNGCYVLTENQFRNARAALASHASPPSVDAAPLPSSTVDGSNKADTGVKLPPIGDELYDHYNIMSAQTHEALVKEYARKAIRAMKEKTP